MIGSKIFDITKNTENYIEWKQKGLFESDTKIYKNIAPTLLTCCYKIKIFAKDKRNGI